MVGETMEPCGGMGMESGEGTVVRWSGKEDDALACGRAHRAERDAGPAGETRRVGGGEWTGRDRAGQGEWTRRDKARGPRRVGETREDGGIMCDQKNTRQLTSHLVLAYGSDSGSDSATYTHYTSPSYTGRNPVANTEPRPQSRLCPQPSTVPRLRPLERSHRRIRGRHRCRHARPCWARCDRVSKSARRSWTERQRSHWTG